MTITHTTVFLITTVSTKCLHLVLTVIQLSFLQ